MKLIRKPRDIYYGTVRPTSRPRPAWMYDSTLLPRTPVPMAKE